MFEFALCEWGLDHSHILDRWTDEQFELYLDHLTRRKRREADAWQAEAPKPQVRQESFQDFTSRWKRETGR